MKSKPDILGFILVSGIGLLIASFARKKPKSWTSKQNANSNPTGDANGAAEKNERRANPEFFIGPKSEGKRRESTYYTNDSKRTQRYAFIAAIGGCLAAIFAGWQAWTAEKAFQAEQRPWVSISEIDRPVVEGDFVSFVFLFKNTGRTPTRGLWIDANVISSPRADIWIAKEKEFCDHGKGVADENSAIFDKNFFISSIVPQGSFPITAMVTRPNWGKIPLSDLQIEGPNIVGCAVYGTRTDKIIHKTGFLAPVEVNGDKVSIGYLRAINPD